MATALKALLTHRHWQTYSNFRREYERAAASLGLEHSCPSRSQFHRWLEGQLKDLPYPDHCQVLEKMFPGWSAAQLMSAESHSRVGVQPSQPTLPALMDLVVNEMTGPSSNPARWGRDAASFPLHSGQGTVLGSESPELARRLVTLARTERWDAEELQLISSLAGNLIELNTYVTLDIAPNADATISYRRTLLNLTDRPVTRITGKIWMEHVPNQITVSPGIQGDRDIRMTRIHETPNHLRYACELLPAIEPGGTGVLSVVCGGIKFVADHYWCSAIARFTRQYTIRIQHRANRRLLTCESLEEFEDGQQRSAEEGLLWNQTADGVEIVQTRDYLRPNQVITLRWKLEEI